MNIIPTENVQNLDQEPCQVTADCLSISLILRKIFKNFKNVELLTLSCVSKLWNYEARSLIRDRGNTIAFIKPDAKCGNLAAFSSDLQRMNCVPFSGIRCILGTGLHPHEQCQPSPTALVDRTVILQRMSWRQISFKISGLWRNENCQSFLLMKQILQDFGGSLEKMLISTFYTRNEVIEQFVQECNFPRLKILTLYEQGMDMSDSYINFLKTLISHAPNLQELRSLAPLRWQASAIQGTSVRLIYPSCPSVEDVPESIIDVLSLTSLNLSCDVENFDVVRFNRITPRLLQISSTTITSISMDSVLAVPLMCYGICLGNVTELLVLVYFRRLFRLQPRVLRLLREFDFTRIFPNLNTVTLRCVENLHEIFPQDINTLLEPARAVYQQPQPDRAANIKHINLFLDDSTIRFFAQMFPDIEELAVKGCDVGDTDISAEDYAHIWTYWADLKELETRYHRGLQSTERIGNLDSAFCGIFPEEVAELREKNEQYLKAVNIVPVMPSITRLKSLRKLKVTYFEVTHQEPTFDDLPLIFSKVTAFLAFRRCPELASVSLEMNARRLPSMIETGPRVSVIYSRP